MAIFATAGPKALAELRAGGMDPAHGGEAGRKRGQRNAEHARAIEEWKGEPGNGVGDSDFTRDILPRLQGVPLNALVQATGLSLRYCSLIRQGLKVPHPRHREALARLLTEP